MPKPSLSSLAAGVMSRLGQLTVQTAKQARTQAERATRKSLTEVTKLLDSAIEATSQEGSTESKTTTKTKALTTKGKRRTTKR